jgi:hypothetical protein
MFRSTGADAAPSPPVTQRNLVPFRPLRAVPVHVSFHGALALREPVAGDAGHRALVVVVVVGGAVVADVDGGVRLFAPSPAG